MSVVRHRPNGMLLSFVLGQSTVRMVQWRDACRPTDGAKRDPLSNRLPSRDC